MKPTKSKLRRRSQEEFEAANLEDVIEKSDAANPEAEVEIPKSQSRGHKAKAANEKPGRKIGTRICKAKTVKPKKNANPRPREKICKVEIASLEM